MVAGWVLVGDTSLRGAPVTAHLRVQVSPRGRAGDVDQAFPRMTAQGGLVVTWTQMACSRRLVRIGWIDELFLRLPGDEPPPPAPRLGDAQSLGCNGRHSHRMHESGTYAMIA